MSKHGASQNQENALVKGQVDCLVSLLPCPFCGSVPTQKERWRREYKWHVIECDNHEFSEIKVEAPFKIAAIEEWNTRWK